MATSLTRMVKLDHLVEFRQASVLHLPFEPQRFDRAYMIHVGMNLSDKAAAYRQVRRVLKTGRALCCLRHPARRRWPRSVSGAWATSQDTSFVDDLSTYESAFRMAGFRVTHERRRGAFAIEFTEQIVARMAQTSPPPLGLHLVLGDNMREMAKNTLAMMQEGLIEPIELFARAE